MDPVEIAVFFDRAWGPLAGVMATSLLANANPERRYILHAFEEGADAGDLDALRSLTTSKFEVRVHDLNQLLAATGSRHLGDSIALQRLLLGELLPDARRVLYLDLDLVVLRDVAELFDTDLSGAPIAACVDLHIQRLVLRGRRVPPHIFDRVPPHIFDGTYGAYFTKILQLTPKALARYFNSGVMMLDLDALRTLKIAAHAREIIARQKTPFLIPDQCLLNRLFAERMKELDPRWNALVPVSRFRLRVRSDDFSRRQLAALADAFIVHFAGNKPWRHHLRPRTGAWWAYALASPTRRRILADFWHEARTQKRWTTLLSLALAPFQIASGIPRLLAARTKLTRRGEGVARG